MKVPLISLDLLYGLRNASSKQVTGIYNATAKHERFPVHSWLDVDSVSSSRTADLSWHQG